MSERLHTLSLDTLDQVAPNQPKITSYPQPKEVLNDSTLQLWYNFCLTLKHTNITTIICHLAELLLEMDHCAFPTYMLNIYTHSLWTRCLRRSWVTCWCQACWVLAVDTVTVAAAALARSALLRELPGSIPVTFWLSSTKLFNTLFEALTAAAAAAAAALGVSVVCAVAMLLLVALLVLPRRFNNDLTRNVVTINVTIVGKVDSG